jgi:hypothetical protein
VVSINKKIVINHNTILKTDFSNLLPATQASLEADIELWWFISGDISRFQIFLVYANYLPKYA